MTRGVRVGLTGGIGSGKSTVAALLAKHGAHCIDADAISRAITAPGGAAIPRIQAAFGPSVIDDQGALDRQAMRTLVFQNPAARSALEGIIHPLVGTAIAEATQQADTQQAKCIVYDIPLLVESAHWRHSLEKILVIDCHERTQIARVMQRNQLTQGDVQSIMAAQASRSERLAAADVVIFNDGVTLLELELLVQQICVQFGL
jgi:dephospho-CoA kinase